MKMCLSDILSPSVCAVLFMWGRMLMFLGSIVTLGAVVVDYGFVLDEGEMSVVQHVYDYAWWGYFVSYIIHLRQFGISPPSQNSIICPVFSM